MPDFLSVIITLIYICCGTVKANSDSNVSSLCDSAAHIAAREFNIPIEVLLTITRVETGRSVEGQLAPWPWTVNMEGTGHWFSNRKHAQVFTLDRHRGGATTFDLGCFQINYKWHGSFFESIEEMFDPLLNARYAAGFLKKLHRELGNWTAAAGAFHSRTPSRAETYVARFDKIRLDVNLFPLERPPATGLALGIFERRGVLNVSTNLPNPLTSGGSPKLGSLFPRTRRLRGLVRHAKSG